MVALKKTRLVRVRRELGKHRKLSRVSELMVWLIVLALEFKARKSY